MVNVERHSKRTLPFGTTADFIKEKGLSLTVKALGKNRALACSGEHILHLAQKRALQQLVIDTVEAIEFLQQLPLALVQL